MIPSTRRSPSRPDPVLSVPRGQECARRRSRESPSATHGTRAGNPTRISSLGPKRHDALDHASINWRGQSSLTWLRSPRLWRGCRESNSDLTVRSRTPLSVGPHPPSCVPDMCNRGTRRFFDFGRRCRTRTGIQSLEDSVLVLLNEAPSLLLVRDAGIEPASSRLKGECIATSANPANLSRCAGVRAHS